MPDARTPPHNLETERAVLGAVLLVPAALDDLAALETDEFFLPAHREIVDAMRALASRHRPPDIVMVSDELKARQMLERLEGGEAYLGRLVHEACLREMLPHYVGVIAGHALGRRLLASCAETMSRIYAGAAADELLADHRRGVGELEVHGAGGPVRVGDDIERVITEIEQRGREPDKFLVPSGIQAIDRKLGGLRREHLIIIAANPGRGKTSLAWDWSINAAEAGIPVLVFSLEMSRGELIERAFAYKGRINGRAVSFGRMDMVEWRRLNGVLGGLAGLPLWVDDRPLTLSQICAEARRWRARHAPEERALVVIDYLGLISPDADERTREQEISKMTRTLKLLTKKAQLNCPIVLCAQLNRDNIGKDAKMRKPVLRDLRDSGAIEQDADMVIFPWWEKEAPATGRHPAQLLVEKYRGGARGTINLVWEPEFLSFGDPTEEEEYQLQLDMQGFDT